MASVISYTRHNCKKCMKCMQVCPVNAIRMENNRVLIDQENCINCGKCVRSCHYSGLCAKGSTLVDIQNYDYTICLVPSALIASCGSQEEAEILLAAIQSLGFDEVLDLTAVEAQLHEEMVHLSHASQDPPILSSFCPMVNHLIRTQYPVLINHVVPLNYPTEVLAKQCRKTHEDKGKVGIFNLCECVAKLELAKYPYNHPQYEVDHALSLADTFPELQKHMGSQRLATTFCSQGLRLASIRGLDQSKGSIVADGYDKVSTLLEYAEVDGLKGTQRILLYPCFNGCVGGNLLWGNSFLAQEHLDALTKLATAKPALIQKELLFGETVIQDDKEMASIEERLSEFAQVSEVLEKLPGYDCGACGIASCRQMAQAIVRKEKKLEDCRIRREDGNESK